METDTMIDTVENVEAPAETTEPVETDETETTTEVVEAPVVPTAVTVPSNDEKVRPADRLDRVTELLTAANADPALRDEYDARAFELAAKHLTQRIGDQPVLDRFVKLPAYNLSGEGSMRYTRERATLLLKIADADYVAGRLLHTSYWYPSPKSGRRNYHVTLWGAQHDLDRVTTLFFALQARALGDAYAEENVPTVGKRPADQTKARRAWMVKFAEQVGDTLNGVFVPGIERSKMGNALSDRATKAHEAEEAWAATNARLSDPVLTSSVED